MQAEKQLTRLNVGMLKVLLQVGMLMLVRYGKRSMKLELTEASSERKTQEQS